MRIGVDYYPEQWDRSLWEKDVAMMKDAGVKVVRMGEFAWSRLEPQEGKYDFSWLDEIIGLFEKAGIEVFLGTPTNTPPLWLYEKYPEVIQVGKDGSPVSIGIRGHRCLNSPVYRGFCKKIIKKMVSRYKDRTSVIGYQIDNELEANHCCCPVCQQEFRKFIREKYKNIDEVNKAYGNSVWSGEYSDFSQIGPPFGPHQTWLNPSYMLDFNRYASKSTVEYVEFQRKLIHDMDSKALITTNNWLCENMPDFYDMFEKLDFVSYDNYPATLLPEDKESLYSHAFHLDLMRGIKEKNFWIMEQLSGPLGGWAPMSQTLQPGMLKGYSLQAIAHGADTVVHFRWRTAVSGAEMFWHGLIDQSNVPGRRFEEFQELCRTVDEWRELEGSTPESQVAIIYGSDQEYAFKIQPQVEGMHYFTQLKAYHDAFASLGIGVDIVDARSDLSKYKVVVAPTLFVTDREMVDKLDAYAKRGGRLVLTNRSGVKDDNNRCIMSPLPSVFADMAGVHVEEYDAIGKRWQKLHISQAAWLLQDKRMWAERQGDELACQLWCDILESDGAEVLARYGENFYEGRAAITANQYGAGEVYYVGTVMNRCGMVSLMSEIIRKAGISHIENLPFGVEHTVRRKGKDRWHFLFNNTSSNQEFEMRWRLPAGMRNNYDEAICLLPFEMKMWKEED
ncbi:MAG: beta-galactosidase [Lachnospiraceae bacterium]|nr:beta-galactosidase [Lachnospiraceae bacterium]